ncbi:copper chaperone PCu(A)C [Iamia majanohamensis]|uniref:Copper chaperone PCu(A)C n=1 Tax=Iamia majanohamensis TaxID=467976 RepID=A0AAE9YF46_9ACTN|nr:copper chaperone PCu(A)C [Iamia majanohamensis]WCO67427.1 copper chaperone PCu(A)C [Iamia majanohamensis]
MTRTWRGRTAALVAVLALALAAAACGSDDDSAGGVEVSDAWARTSPEGVEAGAAYMVLTSDEDDALVAASVPTDVAGTTEVHETVAADEAGGDDGGDMDMDEGAAEGGDDMDMGDAGGDDMDMGGMTMQEVERIPLPAGEAVALEPGGYHVMLLDLAGPLEEGDTFTVSLTFESGATQDVEVEVRDDAP